MLTLLSLTCPQCAAPLPRAARWRTVACAYCGATVVRGAETVERAAFRQAWQRTQAAPAEGRELQWRGARYRLLAPLGRGEHAEVWLAQRHSAVPERVTLKLALDEGIARDRLQAELTVLDAMQSLTTPGAAYFSRRLPQPLGLGLAEGVAGGARSALLLRHPPGYWGSLAEVRRLNPQGLDPRHGVWLWRRMLEVLAFVHDNGRVHGALTPEHALVHPRDHGVLLIGWADARSPLSAEHHDASARDLMQSAWTIRALLAGHAADVPGFGARTPAPFAELLRQCSEDAATCARLGAQGIEQALSIASREAFGAPQFIPFHPAPQGA
ncbi:MAG: protein kinase family protein [Variovorax sp.]|nr:MAG: protein kinase family protein [Variovorax sp.]